jgi:RNA polymerase sigma-70 factor (ECF subfamily)
VAHRELPQALRGKVGPSDLVQEPAVEAQRGFAGFRGTTAEECFAWLRSILRNNVIDTVRHYEITQKRAADLEISLATVAGRRQGGMVELPHGRPDGSAIRREDADALTRALGRLSDDRSTENGPRVHPCGRSNATAKTFGVRLSEDSRRRC